VLLFKIFNQQCEQIGQTLFGGTQAAALAIQFLECSNAALILASLRMTAGRVVESRAAYSLRTAVALIVSSLPGLDSTP